MKSPADFVQPPRVAAWLINLFTPSEAEESIHGDLLEEFSQLASKSGASVARSWYWRQTVKTIAHLGAAGFRVALSGHPKPANDGHLKTGQRE